MDRRKTHWLISGSFVVSSGRIHSAGAYRDSKEYASLAEREMQTSNLAEKFAEEADHFATENETATPL